MKALREYFKYKNEDYCQITIPYKFTLIISQNKSGFELSYHDDPNHLEDMVIAIMEGMHSGEIGKRIEAGELEVVDIDDSVIDKIAELKDKKLFWLAENLEIFTE